MFFFGNSAAQAITSKINHYELLYSKVKVMTSNLEVQISN